MRIAGLRIRVNLTAIADEARRSVPMEQSTATRVLVVPDDASCEMAQWFHILGNWQTAARRSRKGFVRKGLAPLACERGRRHPDAARHPRPGTRPWSRRISSLHSPVVVCLASACGALCPGEGDFLIRNVHIGDGTRNGGKTLDDSENGQHSTAQVNTRKARLRLCQAVGDAPY